MHGVPAIRSLAAASALSILLIGGAPLVPALRGDGATVEARQPTKQRPETELEAIARSNGWTMDQARAYIRTEAALDDVLAAIEAQAPGILTGAGVAPDPEAPPPMRVKGPTPPTIDAIVAGADVPILLVDDQPWSFDENDERLSRVQQALLALDPRLGFFKLTVDITRRGTIEASVARASGITDEEAAAIVASLPEDLRDGVELTVIDPPIDAFLCDAQAEGPSASASPSPSPSPFPSSSPDPGQAPCLDLPPGWGPLAVIDDPGIDGSDRGLGPGRLSIGPRCVTLRLDDGSRYTLVWRAGDTRWDPDNRQILFVDRDLGLLRLSDGERMTLGGFPAGTFASPTLSGWELRPWVTVPDDACPAPLWEVNQVARGRR